MSTEWKLKAVAICIELAWIVYVHVLLWLIVRHFRARRERPLPPDVRILQQEQDVIALPGQRSRAILFHALLAMMSIIIVLPTSFCVLWLMARYAFVPPQF